MRMRFWIVASVAVLLAQSTVTKNIAGQATQPRQFAYDGYSIRGGGGSDCGTMTSDLRKDREYWGTFYTTYATGFLTGANFHAMATKRGNPNVGKAASSEALLAALEQYCGQHPLDLVVDALRDVYYQLADK